MDDMDVHVQPNSDLACSKSKFHSYILPIFCQTPDNSLLSTYLLTYYQRWEILKKISLNMFYE